MLEYIENEWGEFLDKDHQLSLDEIIFYLNKEIIWCNQNPMLNTITQEYRKGFIKGLEQAKLLIVNLAIANEILNEEA